MTASLSASLAEQPERPTLIFMHHPPFATGIGHMDAIGLAGSATTRPPTSCWSRRATISTFGARVN